MRERLFAASADADEKRMSIFCSKYAMNTRDML